MAIRYGVDSVHVVAHSKGGLDVREYLASHYPKQRGTIHVISFTTLSTPHNGSVLADIAETYRSFGWRRLRVDFDDFPVLTHPLTLFLGTDAGTPDLRTMACANFNARNLSRLPEDTLYYAIGIDADCNLNRRMEYGEYPGINAEAGRELPAAAVDVLYQNLLSFRSVGIQRSGLTPSTVKAKLIGQPTPFPLANDCLVTVRSGVGRQSFDRKTADERQYGGQNCCDHACVAGFYPALDVFQWIKAAEEKMAIFDRKRKVVTVLLALTGLTVAGWFGYGWWTIARLPHIQPLDNPVLGIREMNARTDLSDGSLLVAFLSESGPIMQHPTQWEQLEGIEEHVAVYRFVEAHNRLERVEPARWKSAAGPILDEIRVCVGDGSKGRRLWIEPTRRGAMWDQGPFELAGRTAMGMCGRPPDGWPFSVVSAAGRYHKPRAPWSFIGGSIPVRGPRFHQFVSLDSSGLRVSEPAILEGASEDDPAIYGIWSHDGRYAIWRLSEYKRLWIVPFTLEQAGQQE